MSEEPQKPNGATLSGLAAAGAVATGISGLMVALIALLDNNLFAAGTCLIGAALAFGLLAHALHDD